MNKFVLTFLFVLAAFSVFANGNAEKISTMEGTLLLQTDQNGQLEASLMTDDGQQIAIGISQDELLKLQLQEQEKIQIKGVFIGAPKDQSVQARVLVRTMIMNGTEYTVKSPLQLTEKDKEQIREYNQELRLQNQEKTQTMNQTQEKTQEKTQTKTQTKTASSSGSGSGSPAKK